MFSTIKIVKRFSTSSRLATTSWINKNKTIWTSDGIIKSPFDDIDIPNVTLVEHIWSNLDKWPTKTASVSRSITYCINSIKVWLDYNISKNKLVRPYVKLKFTQSNQYFLNLNNLHDLAVLPTVNYSKKQGFQ